MSATAGNQYKTARVFGQGETGNPNAIECANCHVIAVPRGIASSKSVAQGAKGETHCPNCGHVHGRKNH